MSLLMAMARQIPAAVESLKSGVWDRKTFSAGVELHGKTVGVIGLVSAAVAVRHLSIASCYSQPCSFCCFLRALPGIFIFRMLVTAAFHPTLSLGACRARLARKWPAGARR